MTSKASVVASTLMSSDTRSYSSSSSHPTQSTALTTPDLASPRKNGGRLEAMLEVFEGGRQQQTTTISRRGSDVSRGPSVRMRASHFEQQAEASSSRLPPVSPMNRTRSTSPLRISKSPLPTTPNRPRRIPVPATAPSGAPQLYAERPVASPPRTRSPPRLHRGSTRRMVQQWESLPSTPATNRVASANITRETREYLDRKPLPSPGRDISPRSTPGRRFPLSPASNPYLNSPSQHLQTPRHTSRSMSNSPSSWSLSPSGEKRRKGKSPLKEMLNVFGGGMLRKGKGKMKDRWNNKFNSSVPEGLDRVGSNGLPGGIVFRDRMGDQEMQPRETDPNVIRSSAVIYLIPTPCSSVSPWGSWLTSWATLTSACLSVTYCPIFSDPQAGNATPKRVFSGSTPIKSADPPFEFSAIPLPSGNSRPDVELSMADCVEVRSLRKEEVRGRGVPAVPQAPGTEVLEMVWQDGTKRYIGVEGVSGRLGWVSAIWDVLLACKSDGMQALPPPSPTASPRASVQHSSTPLRVPSGNVRADLGLPNQDFAPRDRAPSGSTLKASRGNSSAPPIQMMGDRWITSGTIKSDRSLRQSENSAGSLRDSVQRMFDAGPDTPEDEPMEDVISATAHVTERVMAWQPVSERELSIFSRSGSKRSETKSVKPATFSEIDRVNGYPKSETALSFDPDDLNPSRSASQVGRKTTLSRSRKVGTGLTAVEEGSVTMDAQTTLPSPTHISHVTFPKPSVGGMLLASNAPVYRSGALETIPSASNSSVESGEETIRTPASTAASSMDHTIMAKLQNQTTEHSTLSNQIDGVHVDLRQVILSLSSLVARSKTDEERVPKPLDDKLSTIHMDVKAIENALNLSTLSTARLDQAVVPGEPAEPKLVEVHAKLDAIAKLCEDVLAKGGVSDSGSKIKSPTLGGAKGSLGVVLDTDEEKSAGDEVAQIMAELTGGSSKNSPRLGNLQVLHNISNPSSPRTSAPSSPVITSAPISDDTKQQVGEVLGLVKELKEARSLQTQQTTDIARYLNELNSWLEKFVLNSSNEIASMSKRLTAIVGSDPDENPTAEKTLGMPDLVADMHSMISEQARKAEAEGTATQRLDALLQMMGQERERQASQMGMVEQVVGVLDRQRNDNEMLLRALATDLTAEIRGERLRFVEAMQQATTMNISSHVEEFKKLLSAEVGKAMKELGQLREERKALEHQISDLFALKAKHGGRDSRKASVAAAAKSPAPPSPAMTVLSPQGQMLGLPSQYGGRILPSPPGR